MRQSRLDDRLTADCWHWRREWGSARASKKIICSFIHSNPLLTEPNPLTLNQSTDPDDRCLDESREGLDEFGEGFPRVRTSLQRPLDYLRELWVVWCRVVKCSVCVCVCSVGGRREEGGRERQNGRRIVSEFHSEVFDYLIIEFVVWCGEGLACWRL